jgi:hypothetical protein
LRGDDAIAQFVWRDRRRQARFLRFDAHLKRDPSRNRP